MYPDRVIWRTIKLLRQLYEGNLLKQWQWKGDTQIGSMWGFQFPTKKLAPPRLKLITCVKPFISEFKLNVDGSSKHGQTMASGGLVRDRTSMLIFSFSKNLGPSNSLQAELQALHKGLILCQEHNISKLQIEMDALVVIQEDQKGSHDIQYLLEFIRQCL